ncbi:MAG: isoprenylcysteine carboxylmethyltransferase family protein [Sphingomonadales bacterium]|nr:isoprenylcysteine carboxylmethyltransferase family protein [Sphingomonadales bacterium]
MAGAAFAISIVILAFAAAQAALRPESVYALIGAIVSIAGGAFVIIAQVQMGRAWRVGVREGDAPLFIQHGLFRFSRNPIFVGMMLIGLGIAVTATSWWAWAALLTFVLACREQVRIEEVHLSDSFGAEYIRFKNDVPRWIGIPK